jgi:hypothetical protein
MRAHDCAGQERRLSNVIKKIVMLLVLAFAVFYVVTKPAAAANLVESTASFIGDLFTSIVRFFGALLS